MWVRHDRTCHLARFRLEFPHHNLNKTTTTPFKCCFHVLSPLRFINLYQANEISFFLSIFVLLLLLFFCTVDLLIDGICPLIEINTWKTYRIPSGANKPSISCDRSWFSHVCAANWTSKTRSFLWRLHRHYTKQCKWWYAAVGCAT